MYFAKTNKMIIPNEKFIETFKQTSGALAVTESITIMNIAAQAPKDGLYGEIGSHKGKSAMAAIYGLQPKGFFLDDIIFEDSGVAEEVIKSIRGIFGEELILQLYAVKSLELLPHLNNISFIFVDTGIHDDMVMEEVKLLEDKIIPNGIICFHDCGNQFTAVQRAYDYLVSKGKYEPIPVDWQPIIEYVKENNLEKDNNSWHLYEENPFPNYVGALRRK